MVEYNPYEMIAFTGSWMLEDKKVVFVGTGLPIIAAMHAQLTHAPNLLMVYETGSLAPILEMGLPLSVGDTRVCVKTCYLKGMCTAFEMAQRGYADYGFLGGAQVDMYGNLNSTQLGDNYSKPDIRLLGSGGAGSIAANCEHLIIIMPLEKRRFVEKVDFLTSVGYGDGSPDYRRKAGATGSGPYRVITDQAVFGFDNQTRRMMLIEVAPGSNIKDIEDKVGFELLIADDVHTMKEPQDDDLRLLREVIDPEGYFLKREIKR
jgi:glutaconate CoA-transferase subunit B